MLKCDKELKEAYYLMMEYKNFNKYYKYEDAKEKLEELIDEFTCSSSDEMKRFGSLLINWEKEILNSFIKSSLYRRSKYRLILYNLTSFGLSLNENAPSRLS